MPKAKHCDLQRRVPAWLNSRVTGRGLRSGFEIHLDDGYVADVVALGSFQGRHNRGYFSTYDMSESLLIFEAKASRADFLGTFGPSERHANRLRPAGALHWVVAASDVCKPDEVPAPWGLLVEAGRGLREEKAPTPCEVTQEQIHAAAYQLLWYGLDARPWKASPAFSQETC